MNCKHCGQEMEPGECTRRPSMCPNVAIFMDHCIMDTLTGKSYWADDNPVHCTDSHVYHAWKAGEDDFFNAT